MESNSLVSKINNQKKPSGLGKGLGALLGNNTFPAATQEKIAEKGSIKELNIEDVAPSKFQPRTEFKTENLQELSNSIKEKGVLQPILVRENPEVKGKYELVAGERRWRASKMAELKTMPALIVNFTDQEVLEVGLIENLQRQNLNPIEEAKAFYKLIEDFNYSHDDIAKTIGKNRSYITNYLRVLTLPQDIQKLIEIGKISVGHAKIIVSYDYPMELAEKIVREKLSVRDTEKITKNIKQNTPAPKKTFSIPEEDKEVVKETLMDISQVFKDFSPKVFMGNKGKGYVKIEFQSIAELIKIKPLLNKPVG